MNRRLLGMALIGTLGAGLLGAGLLVGYVVMPEKVETVVVTETATDFVTETISEVLTVEDTLVNQCDGLEGEGRRGIRLCVQLVNVDRQAKVFVIYCDDPERFGTTREELGCP